MTTFSASDRPALLQQVQQQFDLVIIGGGITGAGIGLDATSRGLKVALIEMQDFAAGTSSRSTRLIHGGLRYLQQFEFKLVSEVGRERTIIHRNAPHLVKPIPLLLPIIKQASHGVLLTRIGMWLYELLAGVKKEERHQMLNVKETQSAEPLLHQEGLTGGVLYYEYQTDDARLTISIIKEAVQRGMVALNYLKATGFIYENGKVNGVETKDQLAEGTHVIKATYVVNAAGPWVDVVDGLDPGTHTNKLQLTKGTHLLFDYAKLPLKQAIYFQAADKRMIFAIPDRGKTYVGTTDTFYKGDLANPAITDEDKNYLLQGINKHFKAGLTISDIESGWAGLRPLVKKPGKAPSEISRKDEIFESTTGLISIAGGKLTAYRKIAQRVVDLVTQKMGRVDKRVLPPCYTDQIQLLGANVRSMRFLYFKQTMIPHGIALGLKAPEIEDLLNRYGSGIADLFTIFNDLTKNEEGHALPLIILGQLYYAIDHEMCHTPADFFIRRTGMLYFDRESVIKHKTDVITCMKRVLDWDDLKTEKYTRELQEALSVVR